MTDWVLPKLTNDDPRSAKWLKQMEEADAAIAKAIAVLNEAKPLAQDFSGNAEASRASWEQHAMTVGYLCESHNRIIEMRAALQKRLQFPH